MPLYKLHDFDTDYRDSFGGEDIKGYDVYSDINDDKVGTVHDVLVDDEGRFRYFIIDTGFWVFGKKVLLPVGRARIVQGDRRIYAKGLTKEQVEDLPELNDDLKVDYDYEERVRGVYRGQPMGATSAATVGEVPLDTYSSAQASAPLETSAPLDVPATPTAYTAPATGAMPMQSTPTYDRDTYNYQEHDAHLYDMNEEDHQTLRLYEERLVANKKRVKAAEVTLGKHVETETARVAVPVEKERVVIERVTPADAGRAVAPGEATFREGEVAHMEIYEETPDIRKEAVLREEVRVRKEVEQETVQAQETIRREELDIDTEGNADINRR